MAHLRDAHLDAPLAVISEAFNLFNHRNWTAYDGNLQSATFGRPTDAAAPREMQVGVRVDF